MDTVPIPNRCPKCGAPLPADAPQGLCPKCLLAAVSAPTEAGQHADSRPAPPTLEAVAAAFPQLEIVELIGQGGMGSVFKARQPKLERFVALKLLPQKHAGDPAFAERFNREARVLARLGHPSIVAVYDFGESGGFFFLLMEFVDGVNLRQAMQAGRFTPGQALGIVPKICEALQFAHDEGILHRDIKPENILLDLRGRVKIADFGIAKLMGDTAPEVSLTASGSAIGTPHYMAPEQLEHPQDVDQRADIYSLGVVFYEMLTGELPIGRFAPPSEKSPVDPRVDEVVFHALEREREKRFRSANEVKNQVETIVTSPGQAGPGSAAPHPPLRLKPELKPLLLIGLVVATVGLATNVGPRAGSMVGSIMDLTTSSVVGALAAALTAAGFGWLMWLTWRFRNRVLEPLGLGAQAAVSARGSSAAPKLDRWLHGLAAATLMGLAALVGAQLVVFSASPLAWFLRAGWLANAVLIAAAVALFFTRKRWVPSVSGWCRRVLSADGNGSGAPTPSSASAPPSNADLPPIIKSWSGTATAGSPGVSSAGAAGASGNQPDAASDAKATPVPGGGSPTGAGGSPALPLAGGTAGPLVVPTRSEQKRSHFWVTLGVVGAALLIGLPALVAAAIFFLRSGGPSHFGRPAVVKAVNKPSPTRLAECVLEPRPEPADSRSAGLQVFRWRCTVPANHVATFQLVEWPSNDVPAALQTFSGYVMAPPNKSEKATLEWSFQDGAMLSPDLSGQRRWNHRVSVGSVSTDFAPVWKAKEGTPGWGRRPDARAVRLRAGETRGLPMFFWGDDPAQKALEVQVTFDALPQGLVAPAQGLRGGGTTNWFDTLTPSALPADKTVEAPP
ncbi:MAG: protein kinase [Verrucomicrobia bacterium]|nr:protein kinase [Verrucomicrobiota bacterium]